MPLYFWVKPNGGSWTNLSQYCLSLDDVAVSIRAYGIPDTLTIPVTATVGASTVPFEPGGGDEYMLLSGAEGGPYSVDNYGVLIRRAQAEDATNSVYEVEGRSILSRLKKRIGWLSFDTATYPTDASRLAALFATYYPAIDASTYVQENITYPADPDGGRVYWKKSALDIIEDIATYQGSNPSSPVSPRIWRLKAELENSTDPSQGVQVYLYYYSSAGAVVEAMPLTNSVTGLANWEHDTFTRANSASSLGISTHGRAWAAIVGTWGISTNRGYCESLGGGPNPAALAVLPMGRTDGEWMATAAISVTGAGVAARVTDIGQGNDWKGYTWERDGTNGYRLRRRERANEYVELGSYPCTPQNGDVLGIRCTGSTVAGVLNGTEHTTAIDSTYSGTYFGLCTTTLYGAWDEAIFRAPGAPFDDEWLHERDWSQVIQKIAIEGPGHEIASVNWEDGANTGTEEGGTLVKDVGADAWSAGATILQDDIRTPTKPNGRHYRAQNGGTTGGSEPTWNTTEGGTTSDNGISWITDTWDGWAYTSERFTEDGGFILSRILDRVVTEDTFTRHNHPDVLGETPEGYEWEVWPIDPPSSARWGILDNRAYLRTAGARSWAVVDAGVASCVVEAALTTNETGAGIAFRFQDNQNYWMYVNNGADYKVIKVVANAETTLYTLSVTPQAQDILKVSCTDDGISVYLGSGGATPTWRTTITDPHNQGATRHGLLARTGAQTTARWDAFKVRDPYATAVLGLDTNKTNPKWDTVPYGIIRRANRTLQVIEAGTLRGSSTGYAIGDQIKIDFFRENVADQSPVVVRYFLNNTLLYTSTAHPSPTEAAPYYGIGLIYHDGGSIEGVQARRYTYNVFVADESIERWGDSDNFWAPEILRDASLTTYAKRRAKADTIFALFSEPQDILHVKTSQEYVEGRAVSVNLDRLGWVDTIRMIAEKKPLHSELWPTLTRYEYTIGDSYIELNDEAPFGIVKRAIGNDHQAPAVPTGLGLGRWMRDGVRTVRQQVKWNKTYDDARWVDVRVSYGGPGGQSRIWSVPSEHTDVWIERQPAGARVFLDIRARDYHDNTSLWSNPPLEVTLGGLDPLLPPTDLGVAANVYNPVSGMTDVTITATRSLSLYVDYYRLYEADSRVLLENRIPRAPTITVTHPYPPGADFDWFMVAVDEYGAESSDSEHVTGTAVAAPSTNFVYNGGFEYGPNPNLEVEFANGWVWLGQTAAARIGSGEGGAPPAHSGGYMARIRVEPGDSGGTGIGNVVPIAVPGPGGYTLHLALQSDGVQANVDVGVVYYDAYYQLISSAALLTNYAAPDGSWYYPALGMTAPSGTAYMDISIANDVTNPASNSDLYVDSITLVPQAVTNDIADGAITTAKLATTGVGADTYLLPSITLGVDGRASAATSRAGATFPGSPATNDLYYRTDIGVLCRYDGSRWLGPEFQVAFAQFDGTDPPYAATTDALMSAVDGARETYITRMACTVKVNGSNDGSNYWKVRLYRNTAGDSWQVMGEFSTATGVSGNAWHRFTDLTSFSYNPVATSDRLIDINVEKTNAPGTLSLIVAVWARKVYVTGGGS